MKKAVATAVATVLLVALSACGGGDDKKSTPDLGAEEKKVASSIADSFASQTSGALDEKEATCFADGFVEKVGVEKLKEAKLIDKDLKLDQTNAKFDKALATDFAESFLDCVDYTKKQAAIIAKNNPKIDAAKLETCLAKEMPEDYVTKLIVSSYTASTESAALVQESQKKLETCQTQATKK